MKDNFFLIWTIRHILISLMILLIPQMFYFSFQIKIFSGQIRLYIELPNKYSFFKSGIIFTFMNCLKSMNQNGEFRFESGY